MNTFKFFIATATKITLQLVIVLNIIPLALLIFDFQEVMQQYFLTARSISVLVFSICCGVVGGLSKTSFTKGWTEQLTTQLDQRFRLKQSWWHIVFCTEQNGCPVEIYCKKGKLEGKRQRFLCISFFVEGHKKELTNAVTDLDIVDPSQLYGNLQYIQKIPYAKNEELTMISITQKIEEMSGKLKEKGWFNKAGNDQV